MTAFALGVVQLGAPKGTIPHRTIGWVWVILMLAVSVSAFWIHTIRLLGALEPNSLAGDFHTGHVTDRRAACAAASRSPASHRNAFIVLWRLGDRRTVHTLPGPDHAQGSDRSVTLGRGVELKACEKGIGQTFELS